MSDNANDERFFRSLERLPLEPFEREFAENEEEEFLDNLCCILGDYLNPSHAKYWRADYPPFSQQWKDRQDKTRYLERAIERTSLMVTSRDWDPAPLLWMKDYINGAKQRDAGRIDEIRYLLGRLHLVVCGKETKWLRTYDESAAPLQSDSLELHSRIFTAFELAVKASWGAVCKDISLEEVRLRLAELQVALADAPPVDGLERDFRLLPFRRARLAIKPASESAIMLEPAFCDPAITREKSFASYHDAALNLAAEMADVLEAEVNSIRQENRLSPEQMCRTASQVPHENLGTEGVYWLRLYSVYEEYRAGMMSEAANMPSGGRGVDEVAIEITATDDQLTTEDGPISNRRWQFGGAVLPGQMTRQEHRLASYLFQFTDKRDVSFSELINNGIVGSDVDRTDDQTIAKHGRNVTKWFRERNVPLKVSSTTVDRMMTLSTISTDGR